MWKPVAQTTEPGDCAKRQRVPVEVEARPGCHVCGWILRLGCLLREGNDWKRTRQGKNRHEE
ncbi:MAG: hypothetical protein O7H41_08055 [Planctomycetota bacterium]|nr:hypothetical protein [Planctomycetota bacterium]